MANITKEVWKYLDIDPILRKGLERGIVNKRALAIYIQKKARLDAPPNALISAIRRYETDMPRGAFSKALDVIGFAKMSSKNHIASLTVEKDTEIGKRLPKLFSLVNFNKNEVLRIAQANEAIKIILDEKNLKKAKEILAPHKINQIDKGLAEINLHLDERAWETPGIIAVLTNELTIHNVSIMEIMSCIPEIVIVFKEKDLMNAYNVVYGLTKSK